MKYIITFIGVLILVSCASETKMKVFEDIAEIYNGDVSYLKSFVANESEKRTSLNVFIENSKMIDTLPPTVTSGNTAVLVYDALSEEEKNKYTDIEVFIVNNKMDTISYYFAMELLESINQKTKILRDFSQRLIDKDFDTLDKLKENADIPKSMSVHIKNGIKGAEQKHGSLKGYYPFGIAEETDEIGKVYQFQSYLLFADGFKLRYLITVDATKGKDKIVGYKFFG